VPGGTVSSLGSGELAEQEQPVGECDGGLGFGHVIDLPGAGSSRFAPGTAITAGQHIQTVRCVAELPGLDRVAVAGHDSGGLIARHALAGDPRLRAMGLIDAEQPQGLTWRFRQFLIARRLPGFGAPLAWLLSHPRLRRSPLVPGGAFTDPSLLDGEFDEFFLQPLYQDSTRRDAAAKLLNSLDEQHVRQPGALHARIGVPVKLGCEPWWRGPNSHMAMRISLSVSVMRSPDRSTVTVWRVPVNRNGPV
jgi:pimeloyl-ACP methyl ester carboxylesterase